MEPGTIGLSPNSDGGDYEPHGKFHRYRGLLRTIRGQLIPEDVKLRRINHLKEQVFPLWHSFEEVYKKEEDELMAVYTKYNGSEGIRTRYAQEYKDIKTRISASDDKGLLEDVKLYEAATAPKFPLRIASFNYGAVGTISYRMKPQDHESDSDRDRRLAGAELPVINLVPLGTDHGIPHHHNMNPDDDLSLNPTLLQLLHRLMDHKDAESFINFDDEKREPKYYMRVRKPRCFTFIEQGLKSDPSIGYGSTAFFCDMLSLFRSPALFYEPSSEYIFSARTLELYMRQLLEEMGSVGEQLLAMFNAIVEQGMEYWDDPELIYFHEPYHPRYPSYDGTKPDLNIIKAAALEQLKLGQQRVQQLRRRLALPGSSTDHIVGTGMFRLQGSLQRNREPTKRSHEEMAGPSEDGRDGGAKRQRSLGSASPGPSNRDAAAPGRPAAKRARRQADDYEDDDDDKAEEGRAAKRQRLVNAAPSISVPAVSSEAVASGPHAIPSERAALKRARTSTDDKYDENNDGDGNGHGPSGSKRRRLIKDTHPAELQAASPGAAQALPDEPNPEPANPASRQSQGCTSWPAQQPAPQQPQFPDHYETPSSQPLDFSRNTITMGKVAKMGKTRPWLFGYDTEEGYGIYAFVKCPGQHCKHHFSRHPLRGHSARDHFLSCNQPVVDEQDMVRQYACQVVKDAGRKSDLTVDWARKSNLNLLPSGQKDNHPDNFPLSPANG